MIKPLVKQNVADEVFRQMFELIVNRRWPVGEKLPSENEFKNLFGVSRNTIRVALNRLNLLGLVETRRGEGNFVKALGIGLYMNSLIPYIFLNEKDIFTIMEFRKGVEIQSAFLAAQRASDADITEIREAFNSCQKNASDLENYMVFDMTFHLSIAKASKNDLIYQAMSIIKNYCYAELQNFVTTSIRDKSCEFHSKIFNLIEQHRAEEAYEMMNLHITDVYKQIQLNHQKRKKS